MFGFFIVGDSADLFLFDKNAFQKLKISSHAVGRSYGVVSTDYFYVREGLMPPIVFSRGGGIAAPPVEGFDGVVESGVSLKRSHSHLFDRSQNPHVRTGVMVTGNDDRAEFSLVDLTRF